MSRGQVAGGAKDVSGQISGRQCQAYARIEEELALRQTASRVHSRLSANWSRARGRAQRPTRVPSSCGSLELAQVVGLTQSLDDDALKPIGQTLRKRVLERTQNVLDETAASAAQVCSACLGVRHRGQRSPGPEPGGDWPWPQTSRPASFVDVVQ